ncbi:hypothetical protein GUJ93_ZPchr0001g29746 [Zizania palustris]|uniref:Uncharacterized protein n=1 Tax=Zizania palustris TaxID=103762 RepID=A0A8J5VM05_ZIZPA|nr:hypothetical protein GUJ93_ZPchr0001g29746 [Zizania palustris]
MGPCFELVELEEDNDLRDLVASWNFSTSREFQKFILDSFAAPVHHPSSSSSGSFFVLAVFRRFTFRLTESSVSLALHACLGGSPAGFHVSFL